jgi:hypothetical protein
MSRRPVSISLVAVAMIAAVALPSAGGAQSLRGSRAAVLRVFERASDRGLHFYRTSTGVQTAAAKGRFVRLAGNGNYRTHGVSHPYVTPTTLTFVERLGQQYRGACGEQMVVTSAIRPLSNQPRNSSDQSVHPTGIAIDLRKPTGKCLTWLRGTLLSLEKRGLIDGTEEYGPPHFHVAVLPAAYERYLAQSGVKAAVVEAEAKATPRNVALVTVAKVGNSGIRHYTVRPGDSLWSIARRNGTTVNKLRALNPRAGAKIVPGQTLTIAQ